MSARVSLLDYTQLVSYHFMPNGFRFRFADHAPTMCSPHAFTITMVWHVEDAGDSFARRVPMNFIGNLPLAVPCTTKWRIEFGQLAPEPTAGAKRFAGSWEKEFWFSIGSAHDRFWFTCQQNFGPTEGT